MKTPFRLRKTATAPANALLLPCDDAAELIRLCSRIGGRELPAIHAVKGGFLVRLGEPDEKVYPGVIRLRALSPNLFVPVDAELTPALLAEEADALVRQRGLVFLPGGTVLEFSPNLKLSASELIAVPRLPRRKWEPLPARPDRPNYLSEIVLDNPDPTPEAIISYGGSDIGEEAPRPAAASPVHTAAGNVASILGQGLMRLGLALGWNGLVGLGARLIARAIESVPRISERVLGKQEAALRELLRQFREGNTEEALRRALPLSPPGDRGSRPARDAELPRHNLTYRLDDLLAGNGGRSSIWLGADRVYHELQAAYRAAAEEATRRGDHRRAAFIYGKLLRDWRAAAIVLARGGLNHDAAILYLEILHDSAAAARCFAAAGEIDRALFLYRQREEHEEAGELLMRVGEIERAVQEFTRAADRQAAAGCFLAAGEILTNRARRSDLAEGYFVKGWQRWPARDAQECLLQLVDHYALRSSPDDLFQLLSQADNHFAADANHQRAADFYNRLVTLAAQEHLQPVRDDLIDRARMGLAAKLRQRADDRAVAVSQLFGSASVWEPALVRDAQVAVRGLPRQEPARYSPPRMKTHPARVTAACAAQQSGDVFLGFEDGVLAHFDPRRETCTGWDSNGNRIVSLATDSRARTLIGVEERTEGENRYRAECYLAKRAAFSPRNRYLFNAEIIPFVTPIARSNADLAAVLYDGQQAVFFSLPDLLPIDRMDLEGECTAALLLDGWKQSSMADSLMILARGMAFFDKDTGAQGHLTSFAPAGMIDDGPPMVSWLAPAPARLELAFADRQGVLHWMNLSDPVERPTVIRHFQAGGQNYLCAALIQPGLVAGVHRDGVAWLARGERGLMHRSHAMVPLADAVACFASPVTNELVVVAAQGDVIRVRNPG